MCNAPHKHSGTGRPGAIQSTSQDPSSNFLFILPSPSLRHPLEDCPQVIRSIAVHQLRVSPDPQIAVKRLGDCCTALIAVDLNAEKSNDLTTL